MAFDLFGGSNSTNDNRVGGADQAQITQGQAQNVQPGSVAVQKGGKVILPNAVDLSGAKNTQLGGTTTTVTGATGGVSINDPATAQQAIAAVQTLANQFGTSLTDLITTTGGQQAASQDKTLSAIAALAQNSQAAGSGATIPPVANAADPNAPAAGFLAGLSNTQKLIFAAVAAAVAVVGFALYRKKS